jgi:hypothetical protein
MAIAFTDLRAAVQTYLNTQVTCTIPSLVPDVPSALSPGEGFTYSIQARNAPAPSGIALTNVRYHVRVVNPAIGRLIVPSPLIAGPARAGAGPNAPVLPAGTPVAAMFLFPSFLGTGTDLRRLDVGDSDTISGLKGKALARGTLEVRVNIIADPDDAFLFPRNVDSTEGRRTIQVI